MTRRWLPREVAEVVLPNVPKGSLDQIADELFGVTRKPGESDAELVARVSGHVVREDADE